MQYDYVDMLIFLFLIITGFFGAIIVYNQSKISDEKECVSYYIENNYILDSCKKYEEKLLEK